MSSEEFSTVQRCPRCGAERRFAGDGDRCLCEENSIRAGTAQQRERKRAFAERIQWLEPLGDETVLAHLGALCVLSFFLINYLMLCHDFPLGVGLPLLLLVLPAPALIRTVTWRLKETDGEPLSGLAMFGCFVGTMGVIFIALVLSSAAFFAIHGVFRLGGWAMQGDLDGLLWTIGIGAGLESVWIVAFLLFRSELRHF